MENKALNSKNAPEPVGLYPHAKKVGNLLFLSGVGPREKGTKIIPGVELNKDGEIISYDIEKQCHSVFNNVKMIVEESGSSWKNIVDVTVFLTNMKDDFKIYNLFGFSLRTQKVTISLVKINAVNIDVKIPMLNVTAKPFIGPDP